MSAPKVVTFEDADSHDAISNATDTSPPPSESSHLPVTLDQKHAGLFMPGVGNIDTMTLRCSGCTPKPSSIIIVNN